ncbi:MAG: ATP-dependent RecD-like DNA helicase, partial [Oscillospiraceae bacterium]|nr:ATP-dependent RecD-like DNA helicase [Oscillospiraceae bacterium]
MNRIRCVVERITFQSPDTGYSVLKVSVKGYQELVTVVGNLADAVVGSVLLIEGEWTNNPKYGTQFSAQKWEETVPATVYGIEKYLGSGLIKGVGSVYAKKIVQKFGTDTIAVIEDSPERLAEVDGIGKKRIARISESWERQKEIKNIMLFLQNYDISTAFAAKIYKHYGNDSIETVKKNPYKLADDIWGIGFKTADKIAFKLGFEKNNPERCRSGILYTLNQLADEGHVYAEKEQLLQKCAELLEIEISVVENALNATIARNDLIIEEDAIYLPPFYYAECGVAGKLLELADSDTILNHNIQVNISALEHKLHIQYDDIQAQGIQQAVSSKVMILTGGPGTGKTTTTLGIIETLKSLGNKILLAAPTGRAAKRMTEATGMEAKTIHRLLEYSPEKGYQRNKDNFLDGDVLIVDESSMIDIILMYSLVKAIPLHMKLILVGDIDQLPSVGAGNVLRDIIDSGKFPVVRLTKIFRQAQSSQIIMNAHRINKGEFPNLKNQRGTDFFFIECEEPEQAANEIIGLVKSRLPRYCHVNPTDIQVLTPMQRGVIGATNLNQLLQQNLNPAQSWLTRGSHTYRLYDKVMQIKNNYDKEVFNGDIGMISDINTIDKELTVQFENRFVKYDITDLDELVHAYAITIHKSQGSEYPIVVMPVMMTHFIMLQRNLI